MDSANHVLTIEMSMGQMVFDVEHAAEGSRDRYQAELDRAGLGKITTEILPAPAFYYAEDYHQQYLAKNPAGYCGFGGTGLRGR